MFTGDTRLKEIYYTPEFTEFRDFVLPDFGVFKPVVHQFKVKNLIKEWGYESIVEGLNYMVRLQKSGQHIFYNLFDREEILENERVKQRVMFHFPVKERRPFAVICAGGSYTYVCSFVEGFPVAKHLNELGYHAFVVNYRAGKYIKDARDPMDDLAAAISFILSNAERLGVATEEYLVCGFSAGGHLVSGYGTQSLGYPKYKLPRPAALILSYPVITMGEYTHKGSQKKLLGKEVRKEEMVNKYSIDKQITSLYPPTYVWQCSQDRLVPIENTRMLVHEFDKCGVKYQYKTFDSNAHGWGLGKGTIAEGWLEEAIHFYETL